MANQELKVIGVIPARYGSTRFPGKSLTNIMGKPMIRCVYERAKQAICLSELWVATDDERIYQAVDNFGGQAMMTSPNHQSGTDRIAEVAETRTADIVVNIQGDEPLIEPEAINLAVEPFTKFPNLQVSTLVTHFKSEDDWKNPNIVKAVCDDEGAVMYFSRSPIPYPRYKEGYPLARKHIGLYVYRRNFLLEITKIKPHPLEIVESLEQLRILAHGVKILAVETDYDSFGVDTPDDVVKIEKLIKKG